MGIINKNITRKSHRMTRYQTFNVDILLQKIIFNCNHLIPNLNI